MVAGRGRSLLSVFPGLAAAVSIYGLFATPADVVEHMNSFAGLLPPEAWQIVQTQLQTVTAHDQGTLSVAAVLGVAIALWSARSARPWANAVPTLRTRLARRPMRSNRQRKPNDNRVS